MPPPCKLLGSVACKLLGSVVPPTSRAVMLLCLVPCNYALL